MNLTEVCLIAASTVSVFLLCANIFLIMRHLSQKRKLENERKSTSLLLSTTAHDLRSPLTSIKGFADAMLDGAVDSEKREQYLALISHESDRLARIASRLCESETGPLDTGIFSICEQIRKAYLLVENKIQARGLAANFSFTDDELYVCANPDACFEIALNLFENAAKYCNDNGEIEWSAKEQDGKVTVSVRNTVDLLPENFDVFAPRERGRAVKSAGFGLGLYISKKLAERMGTDITFRAYSEGAQNFCEFSLCLNAADDET